MEKITRDTKLSELLKDPKTEEILVKYNLPCVACPFAKMEMEKLKIGDVCSMYGIDAKKLIKEVNGLYKK